MNDVELKVWEQRERDKQAHWLNELILEPRSRDLLALVRINFALALEAEAAMRLDAQDDLNAFL